MKKNFYMIFLAMLGMFVFIGAGHLEAEEHLPLGYEIADIKLGGLLYDNWLKINKTSVNNNHPLYALKEKSRADDTWRCKECHGWDYLGEKTGIIGVYHVRNKTAEEVFTSLTNQSKNHNFTEFMRMSVSDVWSLVKFIREGLIDIRPMIGSNGTIEGNIKNGRVLYSRHCMDCHGADGNKIYSREEHEGTHGIGWEANADPDETLHKIRWGHPGTEMPSAIADKNLLDQDTIDILSYCQTLFP